MPEYEAAHYHNLLGGVLIWGGLLAAVLFAVARSTLSRVDGPTIVSRRAPWVGPVIVASVVLALFCVAPFVVYGTGSAPSGRGVSLVVANQAGYATSFLLLGLLFIGLGRLVGMRDRGTLTFAIGTSIGVALAVIAATINGHSWLLAPP